VLEKAHLKFCKMILNLKTSTLNYMIHVYSELGRHIEIASFAKCNTEIIEVFDYFNFGAIIFKR
jgi:hypothetical protein